ncbi:hypothetical protein K505DRAFT_270052 [Melanomma pulvis-pyrius CBS 109.77]|uniref:Anaphase-promoting complex subunit 4 n=1 Tax=Melanomma pulvis-pyrius CBS 109.77 TaxID=1314802 RepID=A0A6A6XMI5_9PLEO|nr:hypothetical protein K505DRAFT_270052 [Melanomma pulvis-pyrius CBS 109.77]
MGSSSGPRLLQQTEKILLHPIHPHLICYCPTMDLIAVVTDEENLDVYRINGQRAFGLKRKSSDAAIDCICWEFNGQAIAVAWSDGFTDILSAETGKVIHKDLPPPTSGPQIPRIQCIGWGLNFIDVDAVKRRTGSSKKKGKADGVSPSIDFDAPTTEEWDAFKDGTTLEDFLQRQPDLQALDIAPDLPDQLAVMDMETLLPKLPAIPMPPVLPFMRAPQADSGAFGSQSQVDSLLHSHHLKDHNSVDMFIRCTNVGTVHPSIYDSLETVDVRLPPAWSVESRPLLHTSHPYSCSHGLLVETKAAEDKQSKLAFVPLTLGFIPSAGIYLHLVASKTSQLQNLLLYVQQCMQRIRTFWKHSQDLPSKFMMGISETLAEKGKANFVQTLYHFACTGVCSPLLREWLVDELQEQGHKRWDHTVTSSLSTLISLIHENLLPALDRCSIVISRLRGLVRYHDEDWIFSGPVSDFDTLLTHLKNLRLLAHTTLLYAGDEKRQFASFSKWLRFSIDYQATDPDSQSRQEMEARDPGVDIGMTLEYIQYGLTKSDLEPYLQPSDQLSPEQKQAEPDSYEDTLEAIDSLREEESYKEGALCMDQVLHHFSSACARLFQQTSQWQEENINMDCGIVLEDGPVEMKALDMRMLFSSASDDAITTYISTMSTAQPAQLHIHRLTHEPTIAALPEAIQAYAVTTLSFPSATKILDAKFADDNALLVLVSRPETAGSDTHTTTTTTTCILLSIPYTTLPTTTSSLPLVTTTAPMPFTPLAPSTFPGLLLPDGAPVPGPLRTTLALQHDAIQTYTRHVFERRFTPLKMVVNGRVGRRVVVVLGSDRKHYRVLDLDFKARRTTREGDREEERSDDSEDSDVEMAGV